MDPGCGIDRSSVHGGCERAAGGTETVGASVGRQISGSVDDHYRWDESILREEGRQQAAGTFIKKSRLKDDGYFKTGVDLAPR